MLLSAHNAFYRGCVGYDTFVPSNLSTRIGEYNCVNGVWWRHEERNSKRSGLGVPGRLLMHSSRARRIVQCLSMLLVLGASLCCPAPAATCNVCQLRLTTRTGPYEVKLFKDTTVAGATAPSMRVSIVNTSRRPLVIGSTASTSHVVLNFITPVLRGTEAIFRLPDRHVRKIPPGSTLMFHTTYPYRLGRPGLYRCNVSVGTVDSNILTYAVR